MIQLLTTPHHSAFPRLMGKGRSLGVSSIDWVGPMSAMRCDAFFDVAMPAAGGAIALNNIDSLKP